MRAGRLHDALQKLSDAIFEVENAVARTSSFRAVSIGARTTRKAASAAMKAEHDPLLRREINARLSFNTACELGFRGSLDEWERLMGSAARR